jgi:radical SAM/Cys-rich protein
MSFEEHARNAKVDLSPLPITTLQLNITKLCNQACVHCHVDASPRRRETMSAQVMARCLGILRETESIETLDITGGAPELHPEFMSLVRGARTLGKHVIVRHNLTVTLDPHPLTREDMRYLPDFFVEQRVELVSSLPYHQEFFTDKQRGSGVFKKSIESLRLLNARGYGQEGSGLALNLVCPYLPASQESLERDYKHELRSRFGIEFNRLFALTNMPIHRFKAQLIRAGTYEDYMEKLSSAFNPAAAAAVMCRSLVSVSYDGKLYDCDFNQMLELPIGGEAAKTVFDFDPAALQRRSIRLGSHCYGCTAGAGSSCGGNTT